MKMIKIISVVGLILTVFMITSCDLDGGESLNGASTSSISSDLSKGELPQAVSGVLSGMRVGMNTQVDVQSILGREYYYFTSSDPRFESDVVTGSLDDNTFYVTTPWGARYSTIKNVNLTLQGLDNTTADFSFEEKIATKGVLNTLKAYEFLMLSNSQGKNGIRLDVGDPDNLGPVVTYEESLIYVVDLLRNAAINLENSSDKGIEFSDKLFKLGEGFRFLQKKDAAGFDIVLRPKDFLEFNQAILARVYAYQGNYSSVLSALQKSFYDINGPLNKGVYHTLSLSGSDLSNPLFIALNQKSNVRVAQQSFITDAEVNDTRVNKVVLRSSSIEASGLVGTHDVWVYQSNIQSIPMIKNEELILLYAEANMATAPMESVKAINVIRIGASLPVYSGGQSELELTNEILKQRRYSLFGESHRWVDMRRFDKLDELPNDRSGDKVIEAIPIPANENI